MPLHDKPPSELKRLSSSCYGGRAWVHWTMTISKRQRGWLNDVMHRDVRELLLNTAHRHGIICGAYCLMPDHAHFLFMGVREEVDQLRAVEFFRRAWNVLLRKVGAELQKQGYDHVLVETERNPEALEDTSIYILKNPERAKLVKAWQDWSYSGAIAVGYPDFEPRAGKGWWERFWLVYNKETTIGRGDAGT